MHNKYLLYESIIYDLFYLNVFRCHPINTSRIEEENEQTFDYNDSENDIDVKMSSNLV